MRQAPYKRHRKSYGQSIIGTLVSLTIFSLLIVVIAAFQLSVFRSQRSFESRSETDQRTILLLRTFTKELRTAEQSDLGSYPLESVSATELVFYSDIDNDGSAERIRYYREADRITRGITRASGSPPVYDPTSETTQTLISSVQSDMPLFTYYGADFNSVDANDPLPEPIVIADVRTIKIDFTVDSGVRDTRPVSAATQVTIRNLKDY